jgi:hypothetical protein
VFTGIIVAFGGIGDAANRMIRYFAICPKIMAANYFAKTIELVNDMYDKQKKEHANLMRIEIVETLLKLGGKAERNTLCKELKMPWSTAYYYLNYLKRQGVVTRTIIKLVRLDYAGNLKFKKGHPITIWEVNRDSPFVVAIEASSSVKISDLL